MIVSGLRTRTRNHYLHVHDCHPQEVTCAYPSCQLIIPCNSNENDNDCKDMNGMPNPMSSHDTHTAFEFHYAVNSRVCIMIQPSMPLAYCLGNCLWPCGWVNYNANQVEYGMGVWPLQCSSVYISPNFTLPFTLQVSLFNGVTPTTTSP